MSLKRMCYLFLGISESISFMYYLVGISSIPFTAYRQATHIKNRYFYAFSGIFVVLEWSPPCDEDTDRKNI